MRTINSWEVQTQEMLARIERELESIQMEAEKQMTVLKQRKWALEEALKTYRKMMGTGTRVLQSLDPAEIAGKSQRGILQLIAERNEGLLVARQAIKLMKDAGVFGDSPHADAAVYSTLNRSPEFTRVGGGIYRLDHHKLAEVRQKANRPAKNHVVPAVIELKEKNPRMTKEQIRDVLIARGYNFGHKKPGRVIHMAWVQLGYHEKNSEVIHNE
ncbi:MAG: hypothetical protein ABIB93_07400 [Chloroflexota bacterium]